MKPWSCGAHWPVTGSTPPLGLTDPRTGGQGPNFRVPAECLLPLAVTWAQRLCGECYQVRGSEGCEGGLGLGSRPLVISPSQALLGPAPSL